MDNVGAFPDGHSALMLSATKLRLFLEQTLAQIKANQLSELNLSIKNSTDAQVIRLVEALNDFGASCSGLKLNKTARSGSKCEFLLDGGTYHLNLQLILYIQ